MKHLFSLVVAVSLFCSSQAQVGITGGLNIAKYRFSQDNTKYKRKSVAQFNIGLFYRTPGKHLSFQPALAYNVKGAKKTDLGYSNPIYYYRNKLQYLQFSLPVVAHGHDRDGDYYFGIGPFVSLLLGGKSKAVDYFDNVTTNDFNIGDGPKDDFKPLDAGLNFIWGFRAYNMGMNLQYDLGLMNVDPVPNQKILTRNFSVNMQIFFSKPRR